MATYSEIAVNVETLQFIGVTSGTHYTVPVGRYAFVDVLATATSTGARVFEIHDDVGLVIEPPDSFVNSRTFLLPSGWKLVVTGAAGTASLWGTAREFASP